MGAATPEAYRVGAEAGRRDYPGGAPARLSERPVMPGPYVPPAAFASPVTRQTPVVRRVRTHAPVIPPVKRDEVSRGATIPAKTAVSGAAPAPPKSRRSCDGPLTPGQRTCAPREGAASPAREYAQWDEEGIFAFDRDHQDQAADEEFVARDASRALPSRTDLALSRCASVTPRCSSVASMPMRAPAAQGVRRGASVLGAGERVGGMPSRRERPRHKKRSRRGLGMFILGFVMALVLVACAAAALYFLRFAPADARSRAADARCSSGQCASLIDGGSVDGAGA